MSQIIDDITQARLRSNVESDIRIYSDKHLVIPSIAASVGSMSFYLEKNLNSGRIFTKGATTIDVSEIVSSLNRKIHVLFNSDGFIYIDGEKGSAHTKDFTVLGDISIGNGGANNEDFTISHISFFDTSGNFLQQEASYIYQSGGLIPESTHVNCVAHYPLTERTAYNNGVDNLFFDVVEQYNYANPYSFDTTNFNTWSLGGGMSSNAGGDQVSYDGLQAGARSASEGTTGAVIGDTVVFEFEVLAIGGLAEGLFVNFGGSNTNPFYFEINAIGKYRVYLLFEAGGDTFSFLNTNAGGAINYRLTSWTVTMPTIGVKKASHAKAINFTDAELGTGGDIRTQTAKKGFYDKTTLQWWQGAGSAIYQDNIEEETGLSPITEALTMKTGFSFLKSIVSSYQMTIVLLCPTNLTDISDIITGLPIGTTFYNGLETVNLVDDINTNSISLITFQFSLPFTGNIDFIHTGTDYSLMLLSVKSSKDTKKEMKRRANNSLLANSNDDFNSYHIFNVGQFANNVDNIDLSGNSNNLPITGFANLADVPNHLVNINSLR